jgi:hypothetical protein
VFQRLIPADHAYVQTGLPPVKDIVLQNFALFVGLKEEKPTLIAIVEHVTELAKKLLVFFFARLGECQLSTCTPSLQPQGTRVSP